MQEMSDDQNFQQWYHNWMGRHTRTLRSVPRVLPIDSEPCKGSLKPPVYVGLTRSHCRVCKQNVPLRAPKKIKHRVHYLEELMDLVTIEHQKEEDE